MGQVTESTQSTKDCISRQAALDMEFSNGISEDGVLYVPYREVKMNLEELPSAQSEIIQCEECKHRGETPIADGRYWCDIHYAFMYYCSDAERRIDGRSNQQTRSD